MKRVFWILITPTLTFLVLWALGNWFIIPHVEQWALNELQRYSKSSLPIEIQADRLRLRILRPSLALENIHLRPKGELAQVTEDIRVASARVNLDFFTLLGGRLNLSSVIIDAPEARVKIDSLLSKDTKPKPLPMDEIFSITEKLPLQKVLLQNIHVMVESDTLGFKVEAQNGALLLTNMGKNLTAKIDIPLLQLALNEFGQFSGSLDSHLYLTRQSLRILQLGVRLDESEFLGRGELTDFKNITIKPTGLVNLTAKIAITDIYKEIKKIKPNLKIPSLSGELNTEIEARFQGDKDFSGKADISTKTVVVDKFELGDAHIQGEFKNHLISFSEVNVTHPAGKASLSKSQINLDEDFAFKSTVKVDSLDLQKLFKSIDLASIPVGLQAKGTLPCSGHIKPTFSVTCEDAEIIGSDLWVKSENNAKGNEIVGIKALTARGALTVNTQAVSYNAALTMGDSVGSSDGVIDFDKGFNINYKTKSLDFKNVHNLAHLKLEGSASIEGSTEGNSSTATFDMAVNARDFIFENYNLGNIISDVKLRKGHLLFEDLAGAQNKTQYIGDLDVDLVNSHLAGTFSIPSAELADFTKIFERIYKFPLDIQGSGAAKAHVEGPLNFWKLNYKLESNFKSVSANGENFDQLNFNVDATNGNIKAQKIQLLKNASTVNVMGGISSDQVMNLVVDAKNWKLEESDIISRISSNIYGSVNASAEIKDHTSNPHVLIKGAVTDTVLEDQEIPNSNFILKLDKHSIAGQLSMFGDKVTGDFQLPYESGSSPLLVKMRTNNWNFSTLLALVGGANLASEYDSSLTSVIDLRSESGDLFKSTGKISVQNFLLKRGSLSLANSGPIELQTDNGQTTIKNFVLKGPNNTVQIQGANFNSEHLNLTINARADLRLLQIFTPFLDDLGGPLNIQANVTGRITKPEILGNAGLSNAYVKLKGFPHPLERLSAEVSFSQSKIIISSINGQLASGAVTGEGSVVINGVRDLPTSIRAHAENISLVVPDRVRTTGNADLLFSGRWFPFTLSGTYHVTGGIFEKEFVDGGDGVVNVRQSAYLPKVLRENQFEPVLLDLQIILDKPLQVKNSLFDGTVAGHVQVKGAPSNPVLLGRVTTEKKSRLIFKDRIFDIQNGTVDFNDPNEINPTLYVTATSRVNEYDLTLLAQGSAKNLGIKMSSVPPLSEQDIVSLIALGVTSASMQNTGQSKAVQEQAGLEVGGAVLAKPINKQLEATGFNLSVTSQYDSTRNISVPKITLTRKMTEKMKVSGSRQVGDVTGYDVKLEYLLNPNWTAVGSFENKSLYDNNTLQNTPQESESIFGLDLEFKREFK